MNKKKPKPKKVTFKLPSQIIGTIEMSRLIRELEMIDDFLYQANIRSSGTSIIPPKSTRSLDQLAEINQISLLNSAQRKRLMEVLKQLESQAPVIHISFAVEPTVPFMQKIVEWARKEIHPYAMVNTGLQPSVVVGCDVRTTNKVFDMSLRNRFIQSRNILIEKLEQA